ncbi:Dynein heavy chain [Spironucleus salmonicida]|uniref:Dynein heavy chain n=1 Tax=Spironucleus salmonicida TaxID=348837 RepID=V6LF91_9EUKA|nr:Dynein heavy chain [Spironucleus salmonicida]|eukprot:EST43190.1 Dynein heavy chain [Spironucleus salmonicida]
MSNSPSRKANEIGVFQNPQSPSKPLLQLPKSRGQHSPFREAQHQSKDKFRHPTKLVTRQKPQIPTPIQFQDQQTQQLNNMNASSLQHNNDLNSTHLSTQQQNINETPHSQVEATIPIIPQQQRSQLASQILHFMSNPQIYINFITQSNELPRSIALERKRRELAQIDIIDQIMANNPNTNLQNLQFYDDETYTTKSISQWMKETKEVVIYDANRGEERTVKGLYGQCYINNSWEQCVVIGIKGEKLLVYLKSNNSVKYLIYKIYVFIWGEDPRVYAQRIQNAQIQKSLDESLMRYFSCVENMPLNGLVEFQWAENVRFKSNVMIQGKTILGLNDQQYQDIQSDVKKQIDQQIVEIQNLFSTCQNQILFNISLNKQPSLIIEMQLEQAVEKLQDNYCVLFNNIQKSTYPYYYMISNQQFGTTYDEVTFNVKQFLQAKMVETKQVLAFNSFFTSVNAIQALFIAKNEAEKLVSYQINQQAISINSVAESYYEIENLTFDQLQYNTSLYHLLVKSTCPVISVLQKVYNVEEFKTLQLNHQKSLKNYLEESWIISLKNQLLEVLKGSGKGHFNVQVKSKNVYMNSKLRKLVLRIIYLLNDSMRSLVLNSVQQYVQFFKINSEWKVKCIDSQKVIVEHADNSFNSEDVENALTCYRYPIFSINITIDDKIIGNDDKMILDRLEQTFIYGISPLTEEKDMESSESEQDHGEADSDPEGDNAEKKENAVEQKIVSKPKAQQAQKQDKVQEVQYVKSLAFSNQLQDFISAVMLTFDNGLKSVSSIPDIEPMLLIAIVQSEKTYICPPEPTEDVFKEARIAIEQYVTKMYGFLPDYIKQFNKYKEIILTDNEKLIATIKYRAEMYLQSQKEDVKQNEEEEVPDVSQVMLQAIENTTPLDPDGLKALVHQKLAQAKQIQIEIPEAVHVGAFLVKNQALRNYLSQKLQTQAELIQQIIIEIASKKAVMIGTVFNNLNRKLNHKSKSIEEVIKIEEFLKNKLDSVLTTMKGNISIMNQYYSILDELLLQQPAQVIAQRFKTAGYPRDINILYKETSTIIESDKVKFRDQQNHEQLTLVKEIDTSTRNAQNFPHKFLKIDDYKLANEEAERLGRQMKRMYEKSKVINKRESLLLQQQTDYSALDITIKEFEPIQTIWRCMAEFKQLSNKIMSEDFRLINGEKTQNQIDIALKNVQKSIRLIKEENEQVRNIGEQIKQEIVEFKKHLPLLCALRNPGLRKRHWIKISKETGCNLQHLRYINGIELKKFNSKDDEEKSETDYHDMTVEQIEELNKQPVNFTFKQALEEFQLQSGTKLQKILQISEVATKEFQLEHIILTLENTYKTVNFNLVPYNNSDSYILKQLDEIIQQLDDNISLVQQIAFSPFKKYFEEIIASWEFKLTLTSEIIDIWVQLQQSWLYLEPIFSSPDISKQLPTESKIFKQTDQFYRKFMQNTQKILNVIKITTETDKLLHKLTENAKQLEIVQKGLAEYLETKRIAFPRFYFLSDEELLSILSNTKNPTSVQPFLRSCFENVGRLKFVEEREFEIVSMTSHEGEIVQFVNGVVPSGNVENWMLTLEKQILKTVKIRTVEMLILYLKQVSKDGISGRANWVKSSFSQGVNIVNQLNFANDTDWAIVGGYLEKYRDLLEKQLDLMTNLVRNGLNKQESKCFSSVLTYDVFQRDQIQELINQRVSQVGDFNWAKHPKHFCNLDSFYEQSIIGCEENYMDKAGFEKAAYLEKIEQICEDAVKLDTNFTITFNQVISSLPYQFEYLGNTPRLVITPLTLKIYSTIAQSQTLYKFSSASGPAGSGKTETSKQTTNKEFGLVCVVFNCSEGLDLIGIRRMLSGVISSGGCLIMDEINRLSLDVLSVFAQMVLSVQRGLQMCGGSIVKPPVSEFGKPAAHIQNVKINFEGVELTLQSTAIVIITQNPNYSGRQKLPANLVALFRAVSVMVPNYMKICQIRLYSFGFNKATSLAQKATSVFKLCSEQLSLQSWYDYGMRAINSTIQAAGNIRQELGNFCIQSEDLIPQVDGKPDNRYYTEDQIVLRAITEVNLPKFLAADAFLFSNILKDLFPGVSQPFIDYQKLISELQVVLRSKQHKFLQPEPTFISKIVDLYMTINLRHGLMTLGPACSGKTESLYTLETTMNRLNKRELDEKMVKFNKLLKQNPDLPIAEMSTYIQEDFNFMKYFISRINPKSITMDQLFGQFDAVSKEWQDGILSTQIRTAVGDYNKHQFWIENELYNENFQSDSVPTISDVNPLVFLQKSNFTRQICLSCGYIDSLWIESLNTVLDDSKRLCLNSGEIIALSPVMNLVFNMDSVAEASPATISRCGMLYYESLNIITVGGTKLENGELVMGGTLKLDNYIQTYLDRLPDQLRINNVDLSKIGEISKNFETKYGITEDYCSISQTIKRLSDTYIAQSIAYLKYNCMMNQEILDANLVLSLYKLLDCFIAELKKNDFGYYEQYQIIMFEKYLDKFFFFSLIWSVGAVIGDEESRLLFSNWLKSQIIKNNDLKDLPFSEQLVFDYQFVYTGFCDLKDQVNVMINEGNDVEEGLKELVQQNWKPWGWDVLGDLDVNQLVLKGNKNPDALQNINLLETIIPTPNNINQTYIIQKLLSNNHHLLIVGPTGSGKTQIIKNYLLNSPDASYQVPISTTFSANTQANDLMRFIDQKLEKRRRGVFGPPAGKKYALYIDDLNMPMKEKYGCINSHELIRQLISHGGWYDLKEITFKQIIDTNVICSMCPVGGARNAVNQRLVRHFNVINFLELNNTQLDMIFSQIVNFWTEKSFDKEVIGEAPFEVIKSTLASFIDSELNIYNETKLQLLPTPSKMHYTFNLRDYSKVFQGLLMVDPQFIYLDGKTSKETSQITINSPEDIKRNLQELFIHENLRVYYDRLIDDKDQDFFVSTLKKNIDQSLLQSTDFGTLIFGDFIQNFSIKNYQKQDDLVQMKQKLNSVLVEYSDYTQQPSDLVLFTSAIQHLARIVRILRQPNSNLLLIGVGGVGRQSLTKIAAFILKLEIFQIELKKQYSITEWKTDIKTTLLESGLNSKNQIFLISDAHIFDDKQLEDVSLMLNSCDFQSLYEPAELEQIYTKMKPICVEKQMQTTKINLYDLYLQNIKLNFHIVLCFSPSGSALRTRLRKFPALVSCTSINYMFNWPTNALKDVGRQLLGFNELNDQEAIQFLNNFLINVSNDNKELLQNQIIDFCVYAHQSIEKFSVQYKQVLSRSNHITPTLFLNLLQFLLKFLQQKFNSLKTYQVQLSNGLTKLVETQQKVSEMQEQLTNLQPLLKDSQERVAVQEQQITADTTLANEAKNQASIEQNLAAEKLNQCQTIEADAMRDLAQAQPLLDAAMTVLNSLEKKDFTELGSYANPALAIRQCMESVCILFQLKPKRVADSQNVGKFLEDYWDESKKLLGNSGALMTNLKTFDKENIPESVIKKLDFYIKLEDFNPVSMKNKSGAASGLCAFVIAMYKFYYINLEVIPKRKALEKARSELGEVQENLKITNQKVSEIQSKLDLLQEQFTGAINEKNAINSNVEETGKKLLRAEQLIQSLGGEQIRWQQQQKDVEIDILAVLGDAMLASCCQIYIGAFTPDFRAKIVESWKLKLEELGIKFSGKQAIDIMSDQVQIMEYVNQYKLPQDMNSMENAVFLFNSIKQILIIDPQNQAQSFLQNYYSESIITCKANDKDVSKKLENALRFGKQLVITNLTETIDPIFTPILEFNPQNQTSIKIDNQVIQYNNNFKLFLITNLSNPEFSPEQFVKCCVLNFSLTQLGLQSQLLGVLIQLERPDLEGLKSSLLLSNSKMKSEIKELEQRVLLLLSTSEGDILDNIQLIDTLSLSQKTALEITTKMTESLQTEREIDEIRQKYVVMAERGAILYFCIQDLKEIEFMYQYSLQWYINIYKQSIQMTEQEAELEIRLEKLIEVFTYFLFQTISRSLFESHKLIFAMLMCVRIQMNWGKITISELKFLLIQSEKPISKSIPNDWLTEKQWNYLNQLEEISPNFIGITESFSTPSTCQEWKILVESNAPETLDFPKPFDSNLTPFQKFLPLLSLRPDRINQYITIYIQQSLSKQFAEPQIFNLEKSFLESNNITPILFVLSDMADPISDLIKFAEQMRMSRKMQVLSLGRGIEQTAINLIKDYAERGSWAVLQNCHLSVKFLQILNNQLDILYSNKQEIHKDFRLFLSSQACDEFPVQILQNSVKVSVENPNNLKSNLLRVWQGCVSDKMLNESCQNIANQANFKKLVYSLSMFYGVLLQRKKYGPIGFNTPYAWSVSDIETCISSLPVFLDRYETYPKEALLYLFGQINIGGCVTDSTDQRTVDAICVDYLSPESVKNGFSWQAQKVDITLNLLSQVSDDLDYQGFLAHIDRCIPLNIDPENLGLNSNSNITAELKESNEFLTAMLRLQQRVLSDNSHSAEGDNANSDVAQIENLRKLIPQEFDIEAVQFKFPTLYEESLNSLLVQECGRYNTLLRVMKTSISELIRAISGLTILSAELEEVQGAILTNKIPLLFDKYSFPSLKPLSSYMKDLIQRIRFFENWISFGKPEIYHLPSFFFASGFLTSCMQNFARKYKIAIDTIEFNFDVTGVVINDSEHIKGGAKGVEMDVLRDGIYISGLYLEAGRYDVQKKVIQEAIPRELYSKMPVMVFTPSDVPDARTDFYSCPCYRTLARFGLLSTTGHSTNFLLFINVPCEEGTQRHWVKRSVALFGNLSD